MSEDKKAVKEVIEEKKITVDRKSFQEMVKNAKKMDFSSDHLYIPCPELGDNCRLKIHSMTMEDHTNMRMFNKANPNSKVWVSVLMFSAKDEAGNYIFTDLDDCNFIQSMGLKWYTRFAYKAMEMSGYLEEFVVEKK